MRMTRSAFCLLLLAAGGTTAVRAQAQTRKSTGPDLTKEPVLYVVPYAHLDTQWRWDYPTTIGQYLPRTMHDNFALFEKYPHYVFNFSGANRYRMMKEYYPADFARVKAYVAQGRWFPSGSSMEENDVNNPSAESIMRQVLYGTRWFRAELGRTSAEYMLPDCFGFPASLPSILSHMGLKGFSTQKLTWHSASPVGGPGSPQETPAGLPFNVGWWQGLDGHGVIAALNAMDYSGDVTYDVSKTPPAPVPPQAPLTDWPERLQRNGRHGLFTDYYYYGTGDVGGSPREWSVRIMEAIATRGSTALPLPGERSGEGAPVPTLGPVVQVGDGPVAVRQTTAERMFLDIRPEWIARLPKYQGDLELIEHSAGSLTSQAYMKRWNRQNERLADAAERASVAAMWLGARPYPLRRLNDAWTLVMGGQFHDIIPGTSLPRAYEFAWNDQVLALNQFAGVLTSASEGIGAALDTRAKGTPIVVYNPLGIDREDVVEATLPFPGGTPAGVRVLGPDGREVPAQVSGGRVLFLAKVPSVGYAVYDVQPAPAAAPSPALKVTPRSLENARYAVSLNDEGDIASIHDKRLGRELLSAPLRLAITTDKPSQWPAWNMDWTDQQKPPRAYVGGPAAIRVVEAGPARVALEVAREAEGSRFVQTIRLAAGAAGDRIEIASAIDWHTPQANLKATFPLAASNPEATYNWDIGTIRRGNDRPKQYEVASHQWLDLTDRGGAFGVTVLTGAKNGSDKPDDSTLRLTLVRTPGISPGWEEYGDQSTQDWGHHELVYGLAAHAGDWRAEHSLWQALRLEQPLVAFVGAPHAGALGKQLSLVRVSTPAVRILALKKAEASDEVVVRLVETEGRPQKGVGVVFAAPLTAARELNGQEQPLGGARLAGGHLVADFTPYQPRTFAVKLTAPEARVRPAGITSRPLSLPYDVVAASGDGVASEHAFDDAGNALPAELLPAELEYSGVRFRLAAAGTGQPNALAAHGQSLALPAGSYDRVYVLAASADGDRPATFRLGDAGTELTVQDWGGFVGQWDDRQWRIVQQPVPDEPAAGDTTRAARHARAIRERVQREGPILTSEFTGVIVPGFVKPAQVAWFASHHHRPDGSNAPYQYAYLYAYALDVPPGATTLTLPDDERIRVLAVTAARVGPRLAPAQPLHDTLERTDGTAVPVPSVRRP